MKKRPEWISVGDVVAQYGVTQSMVLNWIEKGTLPAIQPGGKRSRYLLLQKDVDSLFNPVKEANQ